MKQKDVVLLIIVVFVSVVVSIVASSLVFKTPTGQSEQVDVVPVISSSFPKPDSRYFNNQAIDPTQIITIGNGNNTNPFNTTTP